jgi:hypothetical protein
MPGYPVLTDRLRPTRYRASPDGIAAEGGGSTSYEPRKDEVMDLAFLALTIALFVLTLGLLRLCDKLTGGRK